MAAINDRAVSLFRWKLLTGGQKKLFTNYGALNTRANTSRIYLPRKEAGRELIGAADEF